MVFYILGYYLNQSRPSKFSLKISILKNKKKKEKKIIILFEDVCSLRTNLAIGNKNIWTDPDCRSINFCKNVAIEWVSIQKLCKFNIFSWINSTSWIQSTAQNLTAASNSIGIEKVEVHHTLGQCAVNY